MSFLRNKHDSTVAVLSSKYQTLHNKLDSHSTELAALKADVKSLRKLIIIIAITSGVLGKIDPELLKLFVSEPSGNPTVVDNNVKTI
jgi:hypothetical protein